MLRMLSMVALLAVAGSLLGIALTYGSRWAIMTLVPASLTQKIVPNWWPIAGGVYVDGRLEVYEADFLDTYVRELANLLEAIDAD